jgi:hypothetical protein
VTEIYVIRNQHQHYLGRNGEWVDGSHLPALFRTPYRDAALNELVEVNLRDLSLRAELLSCATDAHGYPVVEVLNPIPIAEPAAPQVVEAAEAP